MKRLTDLGRRRRVFPSLALAATAFLQTVGGLGADSSRGQWLVACPAAFRQALNPLIAHRRREGFTVQVIDTDGGATANPDSTISNAALAARIQQLCQRGSTATYVLLAGVMPSPNSAGSDPMGAPSLAGTIGRMKGQPTDLPFGCLDDHGLPTVAVGRFPARTVEELRSMVEKTLKFERSLGPDEWRHRLVLLAGNPGGGRLAESFVESATISRLGVLDPSWSLRAVFNGSASRFYLPPNRSRAASLNLLADGGLFSIFLGHSQADALWLAGTNFLTADDWTQLKVRHGGAGVFFTCGCFANQPAPGEGYGLAAIRNPDGPVAVIGPSGESYAAPGLLAADGLLRPLSHAPFPTRLGDYWLAVQAGLANGAIEEGTFKLYDQFDGSRGAVPLETQRREHLEMWTLLGDPALRIPVLPLTIGLEVKGAVQPGANLTVEGRLPPELKGARVQVTLERPLLSMAPGVERLPAATADNVAAREQMAVANYERASTFQLATAPARVKGSRFEGLLQLPASLPWSNLVIRAFADRRDRAAHGVLVVPVAR